MQNPRREAKLTGYWKVYYKVEKEENSFKSMTVALPYCRRGLKKERRERKGNILLHCVKMLHKQHIIPSEAL